ncbi:MAG: DUF3891 family protein [Gelidibacter sp.]
MIVNKSIAGIHIIFHEAHGLLAGKIANEISETYRPINWFETLIAVCEHDDRQLNFAEKNYLSEIGVPLDFTEEEFTVQDIMERMLRILKSSENKSLWIKLLISYHLEFIYAPMQEKSKRITAFIKDQEHVRKILLEEFKISDEKARTYYEFLRFCDRLSLILCKDEAPEAGRLLEINTSIGGKTYFIKKTKNDDLIISPWIFRADAFELSIEQRVLGQTQFTSSTQFETILMNSMPKLKKWRLMKSTT